MEFVLFVDKKEIKLKNLNILIIEFVFLGFFDVF